MPKSSGAARRWLSLRPGKKPRLSRVAAQRRDARSHSAADSAAAASCDPATLRSPLPNGAARQAQKAPRHTNA